MRQINFGEISESDDSEFLFDVPRQDRFETLKQTIVAVALFGISYWVGGKKSKALWRVMWEACECESEADKVDPFSARYGVAGTTSNPSIM